MKPAAERRRRAAREGERGAVLVELALVLPLFAAFLVTVVDLGLVLREYQVVQNAAREGARYSIHPPNWIDPRNPSATDAPIKARVVEYLQQERITIDPAQVTVSQTDPIVVGALTLRASQITVVYQRNLLLPAGGLLPFPSVRLTANAVFRNLY